LLRKWRSVCSCSNKFLCCRLLYVDYIWILNGIPYRDSCHCNTKDKPRKSVNIHFFYLHICFMFIVNILCMSKLIQSAVFWLTFENTREMYKTLACGSCFLYFFYIYARRVLSLCNTRLRLLYLLHILSFWWDHLHVENSIFQHRYTTDYLNILAATFITFLFTHVLSVFLIFLLWKQLKFQVLLHHELHFEM